MTNTKDPITNTMLVPYQLYSVLTCCKVIPDPYVSEDRFYAVDEDGVVHYFKYLGKNLCYARRAQDEGM